MFILNCIIVTSYKNNYKKVSINNDLGYRNYTVRDIIELKGNKTHYDK